MFSGVKDGSVTLKLVSVDFEKQKNTDYLQFVQAMEGAWVNKDGVLTKFVENVKTV